MKSAELGVLTFEEPAGEISPEMGARAFALTSLGKECAMKLEGMRTRFFLYRAVSLGKAFRVEIIYEAERLARADIYVHQPGDKEGWENWTEAGERKRKEAGEAWAREVFGREMEVKPFEMEDGTSVTPFEVKWDTARRMTFSWGEVVSYFDSKGGFAGIGITYAQGA